MFAEYSQEVFPADLICMWKVNISLTFREYWSAIYSYVYGTIAEYSLAIRENSSRQCIFFRKGTQFNFFVAYDYEVVRSFNWTLVWVSLVPITC